MSLCKTTVVSTDPNIWVVDDGLPPEFVQMVNGAFDSKDPACQVVKKPNGRQILARNIDFDAQDELCQEVFQRISDLCGINGALPFKHFMVSEVYASGQDAHLDHVNVDDVSDLEKLSFLDLTRQSSSASEPRRVVPSISIIIYFNAVGGLRFPEAANGQTGVSGVTIAAKPGRMVLFQNYDDESRPLHKASAQHHGIYFETLPRRVLIMGILANNTPQFRRDGQNFTKTEALVYCASTRRDPLYHDNPSYDGYKTPDQIAARIEADRQEEARLREQKPEYNPPKVIVRNDLVLTLHFLPSQYRQGYCQIEAYNIAGECVFVEHCEQKMKLSEMREHINKDVNAEDKFGDVLLALQDGQMLTEEHDDSMLSHWVKEDSETGNGASGAAEPNMTSQEKSSPHCCCVVV